MTTYKNIGAALADPKSNIARFDREVKARTVDRLARFTEWQAEGLSVEECWTRYLALTNPHTA